LLTFPRLLHRPKSVRVRLAFVPMSSFFSPPPPFPLQTSPDPEFGYVFVGGALWIIFFSFSPRIPLLPSDRRVQHLFLLFSCTCSACCNWSARIHRPLSTFFPSLKRYSTIFRSLRKSYFFVSLQLGSGRGAELSNSQSFFVNLRFLSVFPEEWRLHFLFIYCVAAAFWFELFNSVMREFLKTPL